MLSCMLGITATTVSAQKLASGAVSIDSVKTHTTDGRVYISFRLNLDSLTLKPEQQLIFTPLLTAAGDTATLAPIIINGRSQQLRYERNHRATRNAGLPSGAQPASLSGSQPATSSVQPLVVRRLNGKPQAIAYSQTVSGFKAAADGTAVLSAAEDLCGCGRLDNQDKVLISNLKPATDAYMPAITFVRPAAEAHKERSEKGEAFLSFRVNKTDIVADLFDNARELSKITRTIDLVRGDQNVYITGIDIHGYASPDGPFLNNERLARERAQALSDYVAALYNLTPDKFTSSSTAEDWDGFQRLVNASQLPHRKEILAIAESDLQPDAKDQRIRRLYPADYRAICDTIYPRLRHSDYTVTYTVRPFSVEEAKQILKTRPQQLSLEEMYLVAQTMEPGSKEFNEVFDIAVRLFPNDPTANLNAACAALQRRDLTQAEEFLKKAGSSEEADNARAALEYMKQHKLGK